MRTNKLIATGKMPGSFIKFSPLISKEMYEEQSGEFVCGQWGLKGYNPQIRGKNNESSLGISSTWMKVFMYPLCIIYLIFLQEAMKKKLEIQKQKQELLNKQIKEQKVKIMNFITAVCLTTYPPSHLLGISETACSPPCLSQNCQVRREKKQKTFNRKGNKARQKKTDC